MKELTYATVCSGIECMSAAVADLPMKPVFFSEIEPFPSAVLKSHFPDVPNLGDMSKIEVKQEGKEITNGSVRIVLERNLDIFAGGTPCQDVSVAGKRSGMQEGSGTRSSLAFEFVRLVRELKPRYVLWENVAGVLSDKSFPEFLTALANCGYGVAYRTLDAQWVRVADCYHEDGGVVRMERAIPQRRRRVWVVGCIGGDVAKASQILFEPKGVAGDNAPRRRTGQEIAAASRGRNRVHGGMVGEASRDGECVSIEGNGNRPSHRGDGVSEEGCSYTLNAIEQHKVAYKRTNGRGEDVAATLSSDDITQSGQGYINNSVVECYENHATDARVREVEIAMCIGATQNGSVANNNPLVVHQPTKLCLNPAMSGMMIGTTVPAKELGQTCRKSPGGENGVIIKPLTAQMRYIVRRLTPIECERLMGLPDGWTIPKNLEVTDALVEEFREKHDTFKRIMAEYDGAPAPKPTSAAQARKWLEKIVNPDTCPDAPRYKACGNGWATNQPRWILTRLLTAEGVEW